METIDLAEFVAKHGSKKAERILSSVGRLVPVVDALGTPVGRAILKDIDKKWTALLELIVNDEADAVQKQLFKILDELITGWAKQINEYHGIKKTYF